MGTLSADQIQKVFEFMKEDDDKTFAIVKHIFNVKFIELEAVAGNNNVLFEDDPYDTDDEYVVNIYEALDSENIDVKGEITVPSATRTINGFVLNAVRPCSVKIITNRKTPKINFWT